MPRFVVREIEGGSISGSQPGSPSTTAALMLSVSVLDSAYCYQEMARFNQESQRTPKTREGRRSLVRELARTEADRLERLHRWAR